MQYYLGVMILDIAILTSLGVFVFLKNPKSRINQVWALSNILIAVWFVCLFLCGFKQIPKSIIFVIIITAHYFSLFGVLFYYHFVLLLIERLDEKRKTLRIYYLSAVVISLVIALFPERFVKDVAYKRWIYYSPIAGPTYFIDMFLIIVILISICYELIAAYREATGYKRNQIKYLFIALFSAMLAACTTIPVAFDIDIYLYGFFLFPLYGISSTYALLKYRLMDVNILIGRTLSSVFILAPMIIFHAVFVSFLQSHGVGYLISNSLSLLILFAVFLLTPFAYTVREAANFLAFRGRYDYQSVLKESTTALVTILELRLLLNYIIGVIVKNLQVPRVSLLLQYEAKGEFKIEASYGLERQVIASYALKSEEGITAYLRERPEIFVRDEMRRALPREAFKRTYGDLHRIGAEVIVPLVYKEELKGVLNLDNKLSGQMYNQDDLDILKSLGAQAAISIENARLYREAITDSLTKLYHHDYFMHRLTEEMERAKREQRPVSLLMMDLDRFKELNDNYGHQLGDLILKKVAHIIMSHARRDEDIPARYGGEEFALILPRVRRGDSLPADHVPDDIKNTARVAERIRREIAELETDCAGQKIRITVSIGFSFYDGADIAFSAHDLIAAADRALYNAKRQGRNRVCTENSAETGAFQTF